MLDLTDSEEESDDGSDIDQHIQSRDWRFTPGGTFVPTQRLRGDSSTPQPAAAYQCGRDTGNTTGLFGRPGTTVVTQRRPARGQFVLTPYRMDASSDDDEQFSNAAETVGPFTPRDLYDMTVMNNLALQRDDSDDSDGTYFYHSDDSDDNYGPESEDQTEPPLFITEENDLHKNSPPHLISFFFLSNDLWKILPVCLFFCKNAKEPFKFPF